METGTWVMLALLAVAVAVAVYMFNLIRRNPGFAPWRDGDETESTALLSGKIENWPTKDELVRILNTSGIATTTGQHAIRLKDCPSFVFRDFNGPAAPSISGDHDSVDELREVTAKVSTTLAENGIRHRFEVYDGDGKLVATNRG